MLTVLLYICKRISALKLKYTHLKIAYAGIDMKEHLDSERMEKFYALHPWVKDPRDSAGGVRGST